MTRTEREELDALISKWPKTAAEQQRYTDLLNKSCDHSGREMKAVDGPESSGLSADLHRDRPQLCPRLLRKVVQEMTREELLELGNLTYIEANKRRLTPAEQQRQADLMNKAVKNTVKDFNRLWDGSPVFRLRARWLVLVATLAGLVKRSS